MASFSPSDDGAEAHLVRAQTLRQQGSLEDAAAAYRSALASRPAYPEASNGLGIVLIRLGRLDAATEAFRAAVNAAPNYPEAWNNLGNALHDSGQIPHAIDAFRTAIRLRPSYVRPYEGLATLLIGSGRWAEAEEMLRQVIALSPGDPQATYSLGVALSRQNRLDEAKAVLNALAAAHPNLPEAFRELGDILQRQRLPVEAEHAYRRAIALDPKAAQTYISLGSMLGALGRAAESTELLRTATLLRPDIPEAHINLGAILVVQNKAGEAEASLRTALRLKPNDTDALSNLASALFLQERTAEAEAAYRQLIAIAPGEAHAHAALGETLLALGQLPEGWREFEWRWQSEMSVQIQRTFAQPEWRGEPLQGRTILLYSEQGLGDVLQFARFAPLVAARGGRVILDVFPPLRRLLAEVKGVERTVVQGEALPPFDVQLPLMSVPRVLATDLETIPADVPYLHAAAADVARWKARLGNVPGRKIGLVWAGDPRPHDIRANTIDGRRSLHFNQLAPLLSVPGVTFVSLQKGGPAAQLRQARLSDGPLDFMDEVSDFADTAALMTNLDLVISVDTSVVHLAGGLGKPVWILSRFAGCWRWLLGRDDSPWYPTARLFRQKAPGDWDEVITRVKAELAHYAAGAIGAQK